MVSNGNTAPLSVAASVFQNFKHLVQTPIFDVEDAAFAFIRFENGAVVQLKTSWAGNLTDEIPEGSVFGRELNNCTIYGSKATIRLKPLTLFLIRRERWSTDRSIRATTQTPLSYRCKTSSMQSRAERLQRTTPGRRSTSWKCSTRFIFRAARGAKSRSRASEKFSLLVPSAGAIGGESLVSMKLTMKKLILLIPVVPACVMALSSCTTVVKEPVATTTTTTHTESAVTRTPTTTSTTVTRRSTTGGY